MIFMAAIDGYGYNSYRNDDTYFPRRKKVGNMVYQPHEWVIARPLSIIRSTFGGHYATIESAQSRRS